MTAQEIKEMSNRISHHLTEYFYAIDDLSGEYDMVDTADGESLEQALIETSGDKDKIHEILQSAIEKNKLASLF